MSETPERFFIVETIQGFGIYDRMQQGMLNTFFREEDAAGEEKNLCEKGARGAFPLLFVGKLCLAWEVRCPECQRVTLETNPYPGMCQECMAAKSLEIDYSGIYNRALNNALANMTPEEYLKELKEQKPKTDRIQ